MADDSSRGPFEQFFRACLLVLAGVVCLVVAVDLIGYVWGWLLLITAVLLVSWLGVVVYRYWWGRR